MGERAFRPGELVRFKANFGPQAMLVVNLSVEPPPGFIFCMWFGGTGRPHGRHWHTDLLEHLPEPGGG